MDFGLNEEQETIKKMVADFTRNEIVPVAAELDEAELFPREIIDKLDRLGLSNLTVPDEYGGPGLDTVSAALAAEELGRGCAGVALTIAAGTVALHPVVQAGSPEQKEKILADICEEGKLAALALNEPGAGTNAAALAATYRRDGEVFLLNGEKSFITSAPYADYLVVFAGSGSGAEKKVSVFLVTAGSDGIKIGEVKKKLGLRAVHSAAVTFNDVRVPADNMIGSEGDGTWLARQTGAVAEILLGAISVGLCRSALAEATSYGRERVQFGKPITANQAIQFMLADMLAGIEAARLLVHRAAWSLDSGLPYTREAALAKLRATEAAMKTTTDAVQVLGGYGYSREYPVEKYMRDAKTLQVYEGTGLVQRTNIAAELLAETVL